MMITINNNLINKILLIGFVITFFSKDFFFNFYFKNIYIDIFTYTFFTLVFCFYVNFNISDWKKIYFIILLIIGFQFCIKIINNFSILPLLKQLLPIIIIYSTTYFFIKKNSLKIIFDYYLKTLLLICIFGIMQAILDYFFSINLFQLIPGRIDSIFREPSHFASLIVPGLIYGFLNFKKYKLFTLIFGINLILTFSFAGYLTLIATFILMFFIKKNKLQNLFISLSFILLTIISVLIFEKKLDNNGFLSAILKNNFIVNNYSNNIDNLIFDNNFNNKVVDLGLYSLSSNLAVTANILITNPFGSGLGGHEEAYYKYTDQYQIYGSFHESDYVKSKRYGYNSKSAHSLLIRLLSEFGIIFAFMIIFIFVKIILNLNKYTDEQKNIIIVCLSYILFRFIKLGGYFDYGIYFFITAFLFVIFDQNESTKYNL